MLTKWTNLLVVHIVYSLFLFISASVLVYCTLCLKKTSPMFLAITRESIVGFS